MSSEARIRPLGRADLDGVLEIAAAVDNAPHWSRGDYEAAVDPLATPPRLGLGATLSEPARGEARLAGFLIASLTPPQSEIEFIAVTPAFQRRGVARALLAAAAHELRQRSIEEIFLEVRVSNVAAQALYRACGFTECGCRRGYYVDPLEDALLFHLKI